MKNKIIEEMIKKSKEASIKNRGAYPITSADHTYKNDGSTYEDFIPVEPKEDPLPADKTIDPADPETNITTVLVDAKDNAVVDIAEGSIDENITIEKSVTLQGTSAGIAQNFNQEV